MRPDLSIIIPVFNRGRLIRYTLESIRRATNDRKIETIIVDDGSTPPIAESLECLGFTPTKLIRQANQGLLFARLTGFAAATGRHVLFLDSDDLVSPDKFRLQLAAMEATCADLSYSDTAHCEISGDFEALRPVPDGPLPATTDPAEFCIAVQPAPHSPIFRTDWLRDAVARAFVPPSPLYNSVAEIWFYHNAAIRPGRAVHVPGPHTIVGIHPGVRLTNHWEKLAVASLAVMEAFARTCPNTPEGANARRLVGEKAFGSWRRLPKNFSPTYSERLLALWRKLAGDARAPALGGRLFQSLARLFGPVHAARLLHRFQASPYEECRTMTDEDFTRLLAAIPPL